MVHTWQTWRYPLTWTTRKKETRPTKDPVAKNDGGWAAGDGSLTGRCTLDFLRLRCLRRSTWFAVGQRDKLTCQSSSDLISIHPLISELNFSEAVSCWWTFFGRPLVSLMHLDKTTDKPGLTEVMCVRQRDSWSVCGCYIWLCLCVLQVFVCVSLSIYLYTFLCVCLCVCVCLQLSWSSQVGVSWRHCQAGLIFSFPIRGSIPVTQLTPRVALPCHFATRIKVKTSWK